VSDALTPGSVWTDAGGRHLTVLFVKPGDPLGREVIGRLDGEQPYATDLRTWAVIWRDRTPRAKLKGMAVETG
jgi:hypothetical protein